MAATPAVSLSLLQTSKTENSQPTVSLSLLQTNKTENSRLLPLNLLLLQTNKTEKASDDERRDALFIKKKSMNYSF